MTQPEAMVLVAALSAFISVIVTVINYLGNRKAQLENERFKLDAAKEIEQIKGDIAERKSEKDARRDYEYEARKRLYQECEPLLFQLSEASENALHRIFSLARTAKKGDLESQNSWLGGPGYYLRSTIYNLLAPVALFKLIQRRLTLVDMAVERSIRYQYSLAKAIYISFTDHFDLAEISPKIPYEGNHPQQYELRQSDPVRYWRQGIPIGRLDVAVESLLVRDGSGGIRLKSFGEFETDFADEEEEPRIPESMREIVDLFILFHPRNRPVLWRILVVQAHIYRALLAVAQFGADTGATTIQVIPREDRKRFDWRAARDQNPDEEVLDEPFSVCEEYLQTHVRVAGSDKA